MFDVDWIGLRRELGMFVLPPAGFVLVVLLGLALRVRRAPLGGFLAWVGAIALWLASMPIVADALLAHVADARALDRDVARTAGAIVILGGGLRAQAGEYGGDTLGHWTLERIRYGAVVMKQLGLPALVTGGVGTRDGDRKSVV